MDVSNNNSKEVNCSSSKKAKTCNESNDFISNLPDEILVHILSFLPIKDAIKTSYIPRFGKLWRQIRVLDFGKCVYRYFEEHPGQDGNCYNFGKFIRQLLKLLESETLDKLCFEFDFFFTLLKDRRRFEENEDDAGWEKRVSDHLEMLIVYALRKQVKVIEFDLMDGNKIRHRDKCYEMPDVLSSEHLTHMTLSAVNMRLCQTTNLSSLKVMLLDEVTLTDEAMVKVLAGCPLLEQLSLLYCYGLRKLVCENPKLKNVMISLTFKESEFLTISCPYVLSLYIDGWVERASLIWHSTALDISIYMCRFSCTEKQPGVFPFLNKVSRCNTFRPCLWTILVFTIWNCRNVPLPSFKWKNLILKLGMMKWHHPGLSSLLRNSRFLQTLTMNIYPRSSQAVSALKEPVAKWIEAYDFDIDKFWDSQEASFPDLKTITINGYLNQPCVIDMVKFLLRSATSLQKLVISKNLPKLTRDESYDLYCATEILRSHFTSEQLLKFPNMFTLLPRSEKLQELTEKFRSFPRASAEVEICFI